MKKNGFATSGILYTLLLLFVALLFGVLQNLQNKKTILDNLKMDTVNALACDCETILSELQEIKQMIAGISNGGIGSTDEYLLESKEYQVGDGVTWAGLDWYVVSDTGANTTLMLKGNYGTGAYGTNTNWTGSTAYNKVNTDFVEANVGVQAAIASGAVVKDGTAGSYVRLANSSELSTKLSNTSSTAFWTMTVSGDGIEIGAPTGDLLKEYTSKTEAYYYNGYSSSLASIQKTGITAINNLPVVVTPHNATATYYSGYSTFKASTEYGVVTNNKSTGLSSADCGTWVMNCPNDYGCRRVTMTYYNGCSNAGTFTYHTGGDRVCSTSGTFSYAKATCGTYYTLTDSTTVDLGYRPVVTVLEK